MSSRPESRATVSVVIPAYNAADFIAETIESVLAQTVAAREILVVDDGSTDSTSEVVEEFCPAVELIRSSNKGVGHARNLGFERSAGDWVAFLDADDTWEPTKLEACLDAAAHDTECLLVFSDFRTFGVESKTLQLAKCFEEWRPDTELLSPLVCILPSAAVVRRSARARFPEWAGNDNEDTILFNDLSDEGSVIHIDRPLVNYRKHPTSAQSRAKQAESEYGSDSLFRYYMADESRRKQFAETFMKLLKKRRACRDWQSFDLWCRRFHSNWTGDWYNRFRVRKIWMTKFLYQLADRLRLRSHSS